MPDEFFRIIDAHPAVRGILWGHVHQQFDGLRGGVRLLATPSTCAQFLPHSHDFAIDDRPPAFRSLELDCRRQHRHGSALGGLMRYWLLALLLLGSLSARAQSPVWALHGGHNTVYLAESVHLLKPGESTLPAAFGRAYADSKELVMEMDLAKLDTSSVSDWMLEHGRYPEGESLQTALGPERYARVLAQATALGLPLEQLAVLRPWVAALTLTDLMYLKLGYQPDAGVEEQLIARAQTDGRPDRRARDPRSGTRTARTSLSGRPGALPGADAHGPEGHRR